VFCQSNGGAEDCWLCPKTGTLIVVKLVENNVNINVVVNIFLFIIAHLPSSMPRIQVQLHSASIAYLDVLVKDI
jgi:hypothetical protein